MNKKILFYCLAGSGLGNSSRFEAILEESSPETFFHVFCWGKSFSYLSDRTKNHEKVKLHRLLPYKLSVGSRGLTTLSLLFWLPYYFIIYFLNSLFLMLQTIRLRPESSIHDSDYHYLPSLILRRPRIAISQSFMIVKNKHFFRNESIRLQINYYLYEFSEYLFTRFLATYVLCPSFDSSLRSEKKFSVISPIVRKAFSSRDNVTSKGVVVLTGGSGIQKEVFQSISSKFNVPSFISSESDRYYSVANGEPVFKNYHAAVIQAGHVLISECLNLGIKVYVIPITNHPEQFVNRKIVHQHYSLNDDVDTFIQKTKDEPFRNNPMTCNGARAVNDFLGKLHG